MIKKLYRIFAVPLFQDNFSYVVQGTNTNQLVLVDPANPKVVLEFINKNFQDFRVSNVLYTHKHWDHAGGSKQLFEELKDQNIKVHIGQNDKSQVPGSNVFLKGGQTLIIGQEKVKTYFVPCHTRGHIVYHFLPKTSSKSLKQIKEENLQTIQGKKVRIFQTEQCAFTGDTLFSAGIGRFFEGNAEQMVRNIELLTENINDKVSIFNGHEYTFSNMKWAVQVEKQNKDVQEYYKYLLKEIEGKGGQNQICTLPTSFERQKKINLFVRSVTGTYLHQKVTTDKVKLMAILREMKNKGLTEFTHQNEKSK